MKGDAIVSERYPEPREVELLGWTYAIGRLDLDDAEALRGWMRAHLPSPIERVRPHLDGLTPAQQEVLLRVVWQDDQAWPPSPLTPPGRRLLLGTPAGLVELVRAAGPASGLYGAKITGGGSGGTVAVLGASTAAASVTAVAQAYARESGRSPHLFSGSSPGAAEFGLARLERAGGRWRVARGAEPSPKGAA